jgi:hypothetical protein
MQQGTQIYSHFTDEGTHSGSDLPTRLRPQVMARCNLNIRFLTPVAQHSLVTSSPGGAMGVSGRIASPNRCARVFQAAPHNQSESIFPSPRHGTDSLLSGA